MVTAVPRFAPFNRNCTLATPTLSLAVATTPTVPDTVAPLTGVEMATSGDVVSASGGATGVFMSVWISVVLSARL